MEKQTVTQVNTYELLEKGLVAVRLDDKAWARRLLLQAAHFDYANTTIWLWLAVVARSPAESLNYLQRALALSPGDEHIESIINQTQVSIDNDSSFWTCPVCQALAPVQSEQCHSCKAITTLVDIEVVFRNTAVNEQIVREAINQFEHDLMVQDDIGIHYKLVVAYLNLKDMGQAIQHLLAAINLQAGNKIINDVFQQLKQLTERDEQTKQCPLCLAEILLHADQCSSCGSLLTLTKIDAILGNREVDQQKLKTAAARLRQKLSQQPDVSLHYKLTLAYLNLQNINQAIFHLSSAAQLEPDDNMLPILVNSLMQRQTLAAKQAQNGAASINREQSRGVVLVVDDSPTIRKLVSKTLEDNGFNVVLAADGMQALGKLNGQIPEFKGNLPDLILLDISMPRMNGYQVCKIIRGYKQTKRIPVIMLSGKDGFFDKVRGRLAGSTEYLTKPFKPQTLLQTVEKYTEEARVVSK